MGWRNTGRSRRSTSNNGEDTRGRGTLLSSGKKVTKKQPANGLEWANKLVSASLAHGRQVSSRATEHRKNPQKSNLFGFFGFFLCSAVRKAHRPRGSAAQPGNGGRRKPRWREIQQQQWSQTQPSSVPSRAPRRNAPVNPVGGKSSNSSGRQRSPLRFLLGLREGTPP